MFFRRLHVTHSELSALADGRLGARARGRVDHHLASCEECRAAQRELLALRSSLADLPRPRAPRSFALSPADVVAAFRPGLLDQAVPVLSGLMALSLLTFIALVSIDVLAGSRGNGGAMLRTSGLEGALRPTAGDTAAVAAPKTAYVDSAASPQAPAFNVNPTLAPPGVAAATVPPAPSVGATEPAPTAGEATPPQPNGVSSLAGSTPTETDQFQGLSPEATAAPTLALVTPTSAGAAQDAVPTSPAKRVASLPTITATASATATVTAAPTPLPELYPGPGQGESDHSDGAGNGVRIAEGALAAIALASGTGLVIAWWRRP